MDELDGEFNLNAIQVCCFIAYSKQSDGRIRSIEMNGIQKRYQPEKHYVSWTVMRWG